MQEFLIPSMSCGSCVNRISQAIHSLDANAKIQVDLPTKTVRVDSSQSSASVAAALEKAGYPTAEIQPIPRPATTTAGSGSRSSGCCCR